MAGSCFGIMDITGIFQSLDYFDFRTIYFAALVGGFIVYFFGQLSMDKEAKTSMQIIAHELTHSFCIDNLSLRKAHKSR